jgi:glutaminyl-peptide cyclotransferase
MSKAPLALRASRAPRIPRGSRRGRLRLLPAIICAALVMACAADADQKKPSGAGTGAAAARAAAPVPEYTYRVVHIYPHDPGAFTQGLEYRAGVLYEGTGLEGRSTLRKVKLETGEVLQQVPVESRFFGEGITVLNQQIVQLTYKTQTGFVYDQNAFRQLRSFTYQGEGWGLTNDGKQIYMSDGSAQIRRWDPQTLRELGRITVRDGQQPVTYLNELEYIKGEIYANIWQTHRIARISPSDGRVTGWIDLSGLLTRDEESQVDVLNGIAYDEMGDRLFVTGKLWPKLFEIKIVPKRPTE